jgi:small subunit ribosomal protein S6
VLAITKGVNMAEANKNQVREYELTILIHPDLESEQEKALDKVRKIIKDNKGKVVKEDNWGKKKLTYKIAKEDFAIYVYMDLELDTQSIQKISNTLNITEEVIRYLLVATDEKIKSKLAEASQRQAQREAHAKKED